MPRVHVYIGDRAFWVFIDSPPPGSLTTVPLALSVQGLGLLPSGRTIAGLPVPHAKSELRPAPNTGALSAQVNPGPGMETTAVLTACGFVEAGNTKPASLKRLNPVGIALIPAPKLWATKSST